MRGKLRCLVSIGTGVPALKPVRDDVLGIWATLKELATETENTAEQFRRDKSGLDDEGCYYRFNVDRGADHIPSSGEASIVLFLSLAWPHSPWQVSMSSEGMQQPAIRPVVDIQAQRASPPHQSSRAGGYPLQPAGRHK